jgi:sorting nexin-8
MSFPWDVFVHASSYLTSTRIDLPKPNLPNLKPQTPPQPAQSTPDPQPKPAPSTPSKAPQRQTNSSTTPDQRRSMRKSSFGFPENDPWASPDLHRNHSHAQSTPSLPAQTNGYSAPNPPPSTTRTTSAFTTSEQSEPTNGGDSNGGANHGGWGGFGGPSEGEFSGGGIDGQGFGAPSGNDGGSGDAGGLGRSIGGGRIASSGVEEIVTVSTIQEKEGMFMFQHRNYEVSSARRNSKVIRRYSDFVWLLDCLHKRYPFRQLPLLPPKSVASKFRRRQCEASQYSS